MGQSPDRPATPPPSPVQDLIGVTVSSDATRISTDFREDGTADVTVFHQNPGHATFHPGVRVVNPTRRARRTTTAIHPLTNRGDSPDTRAVIEYAYHQQGSTKHWKRGKAEFRKAAVPEYSTPLGPRLDVDSAKIIWIEVHVEIGPEDDAGELVDRYEAQADAEFSKRHPDHTLLA